jgi:hypothetical protein
MPDAAFFVVLGYTAVAVVLGSVYFRRYQIARPPIGVVTLGDVAVMLVGIALVPPLYLLLPRWAVTGLLGMAAAGVLIPALRPFLGGRWPARLVTLALVSADTALAMWLGALHPAFLALNNLVLVLLVIGIANLWAQSGMRARDLALLSIGLTIYDLAATSLLGVMDNLFSRVWGLPLAPLIAWPAGGGQWLGIGLGDVLIATLFPLVMRKAFGGAAGAAAQALGLAVVTILLLLLDLGIVRVTIPAMAALGPLVVLHYLVWRRRGQERTTWRYWAAEPHSSPRRP